MAEGTNMDAIIDGWKNFRPDVFQPDAETEDFKELNEIFRERVGNDENRLTVEKDGVIIEKFTNLDEPLPYIEYKRYSNVYNKMMYNKFFVPIWRAAMNGRTGYVAYPKLTPLKAVLDDFAKKMKQNKKKKQELEQKKEELNNVDQEIPKLRDELSEKLKQLPKERRILEKEFDDLEKELENILRLSLPPIALAIDALHKDQPNKRTMYYHRDVCIDNIYLYKEDKEGKLVYDDARLMLTKLTRGSHEDYVDDKTSSESLYRKYHHHSSLKVKGRLYHRRHDWNSFGVYILEVLDMFYGDDQTEFRSQMNYGNYATYLKEKIEGELKQRKTDLLLYCQQYLNIAIKCLGLKENKKRVVKHTMPSDMIERFKDRTDWPHFQLFFEYPVSEWTAELLWLYEDARPGGYETYNKMNDKCHSCGEEYDKEKKECSSSKCKKPCRRENGKCQACHLRDKVSIPTKMHCRDVNFKCGEPDSVDDDRNKCKFDIFTAASKKCHFYCLPCYTSGERLFCTEHHGTTSPILGHHSRYVLILYGEYGKDPSYNPFKNDANMLANTLKHKLIYGVEKNHVLVKPIYGGDDLERYCLEMRKLIHGVDSTTCANDAGYTLFLHYSGHGGKRNNSKDSRGKDGGKERGNGEGSEMEEDIGGDWCPSLTFPVIKRSTIETHYQSILECTKSTEDQKCKAICVEVISVTDSCFPPPEERVPATESKDVVVRICGKDRELTHGHLDRAISDITQWLSELLRSLYYKQCCEDSCRCTPCVLDDGSVKEQHKCVRTIGRTNVCKTITQHIHDMQLNAFIDGECLRQHANHTKGNRKYATEIKVHFTPSGSSDTYRVPLAYFNPRGVYLKAFPFKEDMEVVEIDFKYEMKCDVVRKAIAESDKVKKLERHKDKGVEICLLTTLTKGDDYSGYELVCDDNINDRIGSYVLYYHVITEPVRVTLSGKKKSDNSLPETETLELWLDKSDLNQMVNINL